MKVVALFAFSCLMVSCAGSFSSQVTSGYSVPKGNEISIAYLDHPDVTVSEKATEVLEAQLKSCQVGNFVGAAVTDKILQDNKLTLPKRISKDYLMKLYPILGTKYLLTGGVTIWKKGSIGFPVASSTDVAASFTMYDLQTGVVVWTASGQEEGSGGILAEDPQTKAQTVFKTMIGKWPGLCKGSY